MVIEDDNEIGVTGLVDVAAAEGVAVDDIDGAVMFWFDDLLELVDVDGIARADIDIGVEPGVGSSII